jgi:hypothetical protein
VAASYPSIPNPQRGGPLQIQPIIDELPVMGGRSLRKRISKKYQVRQNLEWIFSAADFTTWANFVDSTIAYTGSFNMLTFGPEGIQEREVYLVGGKYDYIPLDNGPVKVTATVRWDQSAFVATCGINVIDGGDTSSAHADAYDGGDTASTHPDDIDGGTS